MASNIENIGFMKYPKFIITKDGHFRLGMVNLHEHLLKPGDYCVGGGYYQFDYASNRLLLEGKSFDFGPPQWDMIDVLKVPAAYRGMQIVYQNHGGTRDEYVVSDQLVVEYTTDAPLTSLG